MGKDHWTFVHLFCPQDIYKQKFDIFIKKNDKVHKVYTQHTYNVHTACTQRTHSIYTQRILMEILNVPSECVHCVYAVCTLRVCCVYTNMAKHSLKGLLKHSLIGLMIRTFPNRTQRPTDQHSLTGLFITFLTGT